VSIEIPFSKLHVISLKEFDVFFAEGAAAMMLFLPHDIGADLLAIRRADRKRLQPSCQANVRKLMVISCAPAGVHARFIQNPGLLPRLISRGPPG